MLTSMMLKVLLILSYGAFVLCLWLPEYKIGLQDDEEFEISELLDASDVRDVYNEEELIREEDIRKMNTDQRKQGEKYFRIHEFAKNFNSEEISDQENRHGRQETFPELNPDLNERLPFIAGVVGKNNELLKNQETLYFQEEAKSNMIDLAKRSAENETENKDYNYEQLKTQYDKAAKKEESNLDTLKYKDIKEEETAKEAVKTLLNLSPEDCSKVDKSNIGLTSARCLLIESKNKYLNKDEKFYMIKKVLLIILIWFFVYVIIAIPLWCQYGWCCCCFRCKFCHPREEIEDIKTFVFNNPPGIYHNPDGQIKKYKATNYETYAQKNLEKAIDRL